MQIQQIPVGRTTNNFVVFDSMMEQIEESLKCVDKFPGVYNPSSNSKWVGRRLKDWEDAGRISNQAWEEGMSIYDRMMSELRGAHLAPPTSLRRRAVWSEDGGDEVDLDRLRAAQPYWRTTKRDHRPGPMTVTLLIEMSTRSSTAADKILWRGAAAICLTELLEQAGYRVEIWAVNNVHGNAFGGGWGNGLGEEHCTIATCYKRTTDPLDVSTLINGVSGWYFRSITFASYYVFGKKPCTAFGMPFRPTADMVKRITPDEKALLVSNVWGYDEAISWVKTQLQNFS